MWSHIVCVLLAWLISVSIMFSRFIRTSSALILHFDIIFITFYYKACYDRFSLITAIRDESYNESISRIQKVRVREIRRLFQLA